MTTRLPADGKASVSRKRDQKGVLDFHPGPKSFQKAVLLGTIPVLWPAMLASAVQGNWYTTLGGGTPWAREANGDGVDGCNRRRSRFGTTSRTLASRLGGLGDRRRGRHGQIHLFNCDDRVQYNLQAVAKGVVGVLAPRSAILIACMVE